MYNVFVFILFPRAQDLVFITITTSFHNVHVQEIILVFIPTDSQTFVRAEMRVEVGSFRGYSVFYLENVVVSFEGRVIGCVLDRLHDVE